MTAHPVTFARLLRQVPLTLTSGGGLTHCGGVAMLQQDGWRFSCHCGLAVEPAPAFTPSAQHRTPLFDKEQGWAVVSQGGA